MSRTLNVVVANPSGNITVFVLDQVGKDEYIPLANKILAHPDLLSEQVGFVVPPENGGLSRLHMMGGEFCGNAARSFGLYTAMISGNDSDQIEIEISGVKDRLTVLCNKGQCYAKIKMPLPDSVMDMSEVFSVSCKMVKFNGIAHFIMEDIAASDEIFEEIKLYMMQHHSNLDAFGVMFLDRLTLEMTPVVYVRGTDSTVYESSCGSGTVACSICLARGRGNGEYEYNLVQPGGTVTGTVIIRNEEISEVYIDGVVTMGDEITITLD